MHREHLVSLVFKDPQDNKDHQVQVVLQGLEETQGRQGHLVLLED